MDVRPWIETAGEIVDVVGVAVMVIGAIVAVPMALKAHRESAQDPDAGRTISVYKAYRQLLGRSILLGLELLVAADIIRTVAVEPTFESVGVLGVIVLIRTFLSFSLELEITGRWPWQPERPRPEEGARAGGAYGPPAGAPRE